MNKQEHDLSSEIFTSHYKCSKRIKAMWTLRDLQFRNDIAIIRGQNALKSNSHLIYAYGNLMHGRNKFDEYAIIQCKWSFTNGKTEVMQTFPSLNFVEI